jgi:hypothetical protein
LERGDEGVACSNPNAAAAGQREAAARADIVILAVPGSALEEVSASLCDLGGKVIVDMTSAPKRQAADSYFELVSDSSNSVRLQLVKIRIPPAFLFRRPVALGRRRPFPSPPTIVQRRKRWRASSSPEAEIGLRVFDYHSVGMRVDNDFVARTATDAVRVRARSICTTSDHPVRST